MPGKPSDSELPDWQHLRVIEQGGFAGLMRAADLRADDLDAKTVTRVAGLLARAHKSAGQAGAYPDAQSLSIEVNPGGAGSLRLHFDTADLPDAVDELKDLLQFKPMAPPRS